MQFSIKFRSNLTKVDNIIEILWNDWTYFKESKIRQNHKGVFVE